VLVETKTQLTLDKGITLSTSPHGVGVTYKCHYLTRISVTAADFTVTPVSIIGTESNTGTLDTGFHLSVTPTPIILGDIITVTATWDVTIAAISYHFDKCTVSHATKGIDIIKVILRHFCGNQMYNFGSLFLKISVKH